MTSSQYAKRSYLLNIIEQKEQHLKTLFDKMDATSDMELKQHYLQEIRASQKDIRFRKEELKKTNQSIYNQERAKKSD